MLKEFNVNQLIGLVSISSVICHSFNYSYISMFIDSGIF